MRISLDSITPMLVAGTAAACPDVRQVIPPGRNALASLVVVSANVGRHDP
jgi:hypothetical protein